MADITMPQLGETVTEGTITRWFKKVGEEVAEDEPLFEVSTDKVDSEVPSSVSGTVTEILVEEGATVDVGVTLAVISTADEPGADGSAREGAAREGAEGTAREGEGAREASPSSGQEPGGDRMPEPVGAGGRRSPAGRGGGAVVAPTGRSGGEPAASGPSLLLSPVVRRLISEHDLDPSTIEGTGQGGRITRADVLALIDAGAGRRDGQASPPAAPRSAAAPRRPAPLPAAGGDDVVVPFSNIRKRTAEHMIRSQATSAHVLVSAEVDFSTVDQVRASEQGRWKEAEGFSLTYLPFVARAVVDAIEDFPHVNASVGDDELIVHRRVHLGLAVDLSFEGLIVPVAHDADQMRLRALARSFTDLARRARSRDLGTDDITGSTFTITNPGPFGTYLTFPVINQPQVAILTTDGVRKRPVAIELPDGTDAMVVRPVGVLGLAFDHRAFDGAYAAAFLARVREVIETRDWAQEL